MPPFFVLILANIFWAADLKHQNLRKQSTKPGDRRQNKGLKLFVVQGNTYIQHHLVGRY